MTPDGGSVADADRLPWLEPYREPMAARARATRRSHGGPLALAAAITTLIAAGGAGYWLGQRSDAPVVSGASPRSSAPASPSATVPLPEPRGPVAARPPEAEPNVAPPAEPPRASAEPSRPEAKSVKRTARKKPARSRKIRSAGLETDQLNHIREVQERAPTAPQSAPRPAAYRWPRLPSPGPAGQVVQLGAFSHPDRAYSAYRARIARYPSLARMPRVIVPVATGQNGRLLYVLRLGTSSRNQSKRVCRNLRRSGDHCIVIG